MSTVPAALRHADAADHADGDPPADTTHHSDGGPPADGTTTLHVRNFDVHRSVTLAVALTDADGRTRFERTYRLRPGTLVSDEVPALGGDWVVEVRTPRGTRKRVQFDSSVDALSVAAGDGVLSVTDRPY
jgi:hypothetical protein